MSSEDRLRDLVEPYISVQSVVILPITTLSSMFLVYGIYIIIFGLSIHVLLRRRASGMRLYFPCTIILFILATFLVATETFGLTRQAVVLFNGAKAQDLASILKYLQQDTAKTVWVVINSLSATLMVILADIMLVHRCYILYGSSKILLYILGGVAVILNGISLGTSVAASIGLSIVKIQYVYTTAAHIDSANSIAIAVFNGLLSILTAGRIWFISREARQHMGIGVREKYKDISAAILESGILYPTALIASKVMPIILDPDFRGRVVFDLVPVANLMAGLAPTLIIVRVAYGRSVDSVQQRVTSIHFAQQASQRASGPANSSVIRATVDVRASQFQHDDLETGVNAGNSEEKVNQAQVV